jgi:hypothetical protein
VSGSIYYQTNCPPTLFILNLGKKWFLKGEYEVKGKGRLRVFCYNVDDKNHVERLPRVSETKIDFDRNEDTLAELVARQRGFEIEQENQMRVALESQHFSELKDNRHSISNDLISKLSSSRIMHRRGSVTTMLQSRKAFPVNSSQSKMPSITASKTSLGKNSNVEKKSQNSLTHSSSSRPNIVQTALENSSGENVTNLLAMNKFEFESDNGSFPQIQPEKMQPNPINILLPVKSGQDDDAGGFMGVDPINDNSPLSALLIQLSYKPIVSIDDLRISIGEHIYSISGSFKDEEIEKAYNSKVQHFAFKQNLWAITVGWIVVFTALILVLLYENVIGERNIINQIVTASLCLLYTGVLICHSKVYEMSRKGAPFTESDQKHLFLRFFGGAGGFVLTVVACTATGWFILASTEYGKTPYAAPPFLHSLILLGNSIETTSLSFVPKKLLTVCFVIAICAQQYLQGMLRFLDILNIASVMCCVVLSEHGLMMSRKTDFIVEQLIERSRQKSDAEVRISAGLLSAILPSNIMKLLMDGVESHCIVDPFLSMFYWRFHFYFNMANDTLQLFLYFTWILLHSRIYQVHKSRMC